MESVLQSLQEWCQGIQRENQSLREEAARGRREASEAGEASKAALSDLREQVRGGEALLASKDRELSSLRDELASVQAQLQETLAAQSAAALSSSVICTSVLCLKSMVVSQSCSASISPRPL